MSNQKPTESDQQFSQDTQGHFKAEISLMVTDEAEDAPSISVCRYAALQLHNHGYVVYDRLLNRIVDGTYARLESALMVAQSYNTRPHRATADVAPNGLALGLVYPQLVETDDDHDDN